MRVALLAAAAALFLPVAAQASPITSNTLTDTTLIGFDGAPQRTAGPVEVGGADSIIFTSVTSNSLVNNDEVYGLGGNGSWTAGRNGYLGLNVGAGAMTLTFEGPVAGIGAIVNYGPNVGFDDAVMQIFGEGGVLLESWNLSQDAPISTPGATDAGAFRGFAREAADIWSIAFSGSYIVVDNLIYTEVRSTAAPVPLPGALPMLAAALGAFGIVRRRGRA
jgi:hypothetical protein